ncbi:hypothetical protein B0H17DRAFT_1177814 [Mycena rosella]|uniref:Uncharacterized protein n=1 Tax=Mycena rosella TaxID=1033263 RepID=A0AAD7DPN1_MYCRO|nr:hypothetical protein B0H17DRAFT_1177814 [Mycena rosella]
MLSANWAPVNRKGTPSYCESTALPQSAFVCLLKFKRCCQLLPINSMRSNYGPRAQPQSLACPAEFSRPFLAWSWPESAGVQTARQRSPVHLIVPTYLPRPASNLTVLQEWVQSVDLTSHPPTPTLLSLRDIIWAAYRAKQSPERRCRPHAAVKGQKSKQAKQAKLEPASPDMGSHRRRGSKPGRNWSSRKTALSNSSRIRRNTAGTGYIPPPPTQALAMAMAPHCPSSVNGRPRRMKFITAAPRSVLLRSKLGNMGRCTDRAPFEPPDRITAGGLASALSVLARTETPIFGSDRRYTWTFRE